MPDTVWAAIISGSIALIGVGFGLWWNRGATQKAVDLSFEKAEKLIYKQDFLKAAAEFQTAFTEEIGLFETDRHKPKARQIVEESAVKHKNAMIRFRHHVPENKRSLFDDAWVEYQSEIYNSTEHDREGEKSQKQLALKRIYKLLEIAK